ncbi:MAG TPA: histidine triad nucleotide-binding protein [Polyangia bacterium]|nr:histidine triad nucleotide-binding protein [Polyangia bacterium]
MSNDDCLFCKIRDGKIPSAITYRDDEVFAFKDIGPKAPLHELVVPNRHVATLADAKPEDAAMYGRMMVVAAKRAAESGQAVDGFRVVMNAGPGAGQSVFHVHLHVLAGRPLTWPPG